MKYFNSSLFVKYIQYSGFIFVGLNCLYIIKHIFSRISKSPTQSKYNNKQREVVIFNLSLIESVELQNNIIQKVHKLVESNSNRNMKRFVVVVPKTRSQILEDDDPNCIIVNKLTVDQIRNCKLSLINVFPEVETVKPIFENTSVNSIKKEYSIQVIENLEILQVILAQTLKNKSKTKMTNLNYYDNKKPFPIIYQIIVDFQKRLHLEYGDKVEIEN